MRCARHCKEQSDEAIQEFNDFDILGLLRFARNGGILHIYSMFLLNKATPSSIHSEKSEFGERNVTITLQINA